MREVVVISGKGGTGKTSLSAAFAYLEGANALVSDCDVDAANMHLLLDANFKKQSDFFSGEIAVIDENLCTNCGDCFEACKFDAITPTDDFHVVDPISCEGCWYCFRVCNMIPLLCRHKKLVTSLSLISKMVQKWFMPNWVLLLKTLGSW